MIEISVKVSGDDQTLVQKFLIHAEGMRLSHDDPELAHMVGNTIDKFKGEPSDVVIKLKYTW